MIIDKIWFKYSLYAILLLGILLGIYIVQNRYDRLEADQIYNVKDGNSVAVDRRYFYVISNNEIGKYEKKSGNRIIHKKLAFKHLSGGKIINGDLVVINNQSGHTAMIWINPTDLSVIDIMETPFISGSLSWIDWAFDRWWICDAYSDEDIDKTMIYVYDPNWKLQGFWKLPKELLTSHSIIGGTWFGDQLYVSGHSKPEIYQLKLPLEKVRAELGETIQTCFDGQGFVFEQESEIVYAWGIRNDSTVVKCSVLS